jgi:hypothetical protein
MKTGRYKMLKEHHHVDGRKNAKRSVPVLAITINVSAGFKIKISNSEIFVGFFVYVNFLPAVFIFENESVSVRR